MRKLGDRWTEAGAKALKQMSRIGISKSDAARGALPQWLGWAGSFLSLLLVAAGLSFPFNSDILTFALDLALIGLLVWVAAISVLIFRRATRQPMLPEAPESD
jgi:hypothetical protein